MKQIPTHLGCAPSQYQWQMKAFLGSPTKIQTHAGGELLLGHGGQPDFESMVGLGLQGCIWVFPKIRGVSPKMDGL